MKLNTYVNFAGKCAEAFPLHESTLAPGGMMMTHGEAATIRLGATRMERCMLHASITNRRQRPSGLRHSRRRADHSAYLTLGVDSDSEAERIYAALGDGAAY